MLDEGVLEREAPISAYLPKDRYEGIRALDGKDTSANIRIGDLIDQTSGLQDYETDYKADGLVSTSEDMMTFMTAFIQGDLFDAKHLTASPTKPIQFFPLKYGNGMMEVKMNPLMSPLFESPRIIGHSGSTGSFAFYDTKRQVVIVGTTNQLKGNPYSYIYTYLDGMVGKEDR